MSSEAVLEKILSKIGDLENSKVLDCFSFSKKHLSIIQRRDGISYFEHCIEVAKVLAEVSKDPSLISAALLHDLLVDVTNKFLHCLKWAHSYQNNFRQSTLVKLEV